MIDIVSQLEKKLNISAKDKSIFLMALTHKSYNEIRNNEKLEFLGDRVIGLILSKKLYELYPNEKEGVLDKRFAKLVNRKTCATIFWSLGIIQLLMLGDKNKKIKKSDEKILSDTCEALIGAVYLDKGFIYSEKFVLRLWKNELIKSTVTIIDPKTELQEYSLKIFNKLPEYKQKYQKGPNHNPTFKVTVKIIGSKEYNGFGNSKKIAQQNAAKNLLSDMKII